MHYSIIIIIIVYNINTNKFCELIIVFTFHFKLKIIKVTMMLLFDELLVKVDTHISSVDKISVIC